MKYAFSLALPAICTSSTAFAADQLPSQPYVSEDVFSTATLRGSIGLRYWYSQASSDVHGANARVETDNVTGHSVELVANLEDITANTYFKGYVGFGRNTDGSQSYSGTESTAWNTKNLGYLTLDGGWEIMKFAGNSGRLRTFIGYQFLTDELSAEYGGTSFKISNTWHALRLGLSADGTLNDRFSWSVDAAAVPWSYNESDDGFIDIESIYTYGFETDAMMNVALTSNWNVGVGGRYWWMHSEYELDQSQTYQRYGLLLESKYTF
ncbi:hypothetical protein V6575_18190 [Roseibium sp. H3510]|uniref:Porin n=2 Tax=Roseibium algae TaxID=3123038 RepID=A0ABU8TPG4_9HYPH